MSFSRTVLVTGGTSGLGFYCALNIARQHPEYLVVVASRTDPHSAAESINKTLGHNNTLYMPLDLSRLERVRSFITDWIARDLPPLQALLLNAGGQFPEQGVRKTDDGIEMTFGINHVGHALLFHLLYPSLTPTARIVVTSSGTHDPAQKSGLPDAIYNTAEELAYPGAESSQFAGRQRYATSKLTNVLFTYALSRRFKAQGKQMTVVAFDPGLMPGTGLAKEAGAVLRFVWLKVLPRMVWLLQKILSPNVHKPEESGATLAWLAVGEDANLKKSGVYWDASPQRQITRSSKDSYDETKQEDLWAWTVKHVSADEKERQKFDALA